MADSENRIDLSGNQNQIGSIQQNITHEAKPKAERACPTPPNRPENFGGRDAELKTLLAKLKSGETVAITAALQGTGGIGKTTLARELAAQLYADKSVKAVLWADVICNDPNAAEILSSWVVSYATTVSRRAFWWCWMMSIQPNMPMHSS
jgi:Flp pilus assembly CpaE family ATPase